MYRKQQEPRPLPAQVMPDGTIRHVASLNTPRVWADFRVQLLAKRRAATTARPTPAQVVPKVIVRDVPEPLGPPAGFGRGGHEDDEASGNKHRKPYEHVTLGPNGAMTVETGPQTGRRSIGPIV